MKPNKKQQPTPEPVAEPAAQPEPERKKPTDFPNGNVADMRSRNIFGHATAQDDWWKSSKK